MQRVSIKREGYTIVETMVFLAVTGALFLVAGVFINGKQARVQFDQSARDLESKLQDIINDTATGYFPKTDIQCKTPGVAFVILPSGGAQGSNKDCIFVGKTIQFGSHNPDCNSVDRKGCTTLEIYTILGRSKKMGTQESVRNLDEATPESRDFFTEYYDLKWGVYIDKVFVSGGGDIGQIGFVSNLSPINNTQQVSSQSLKAAQVLTSAIGDTQSDAIDKIKIGGPGTGIQITSSSMVICLRDGTSRKASITTNVDNAVNTTKLLFDSAVVGC